MFPDEVVCQLVTECDPPVGHGLDHAVRTLEVRHVQLLEEAKVAEDTAVAVEGDRGAALIVVDVQR